MDLSATLLPYICLPMGAFMGAPSDGSEGEHDYPTSDANVSPARWATSATNPAKRVDSLQLPALPRWEVDTVDGQGTRFLVRPLFISPLAPKRIDVFIPDQDRHPPPLRRTLDSNWAFCLRDARIRRCGIAEMVLLALEEWTSVRGEDAVKALYENASIGSKIVLEEVVSDPKLWRFHFVRDLEIERQRLSIPHLQSLWNFPANIWPPAVRLTELHLVQQIHDTVSIVELPERLGCGRAVFKSTINGVRYMYHEMKLLLGMAERPCIPPKPQFLVTIQDRYGGDERVDGFIMPLYERGNLADHLTRSKHLGTLRLEDQFRWARQVVETLQSINAGPTRFYSELKPDNLLLTNDGNVVFIDFEQMGNWITFSAPEIYYFEYLGRLATSDLLSRPDRDRYEAMLKTYDPGAEEQSIVYDNPAGSYYRAWERLTPREREAAEVFSVGKFLWCIFEGCADTRNSSLKAFKHESELEFPTFENTPPELRSLIRDCTSGCPEWRGSKGRPEIVRRGATVYPKGCSGLGGEPVAGAAETAKVAQDMWRVRVDGMEEFLEIDHQWRQGVDVGENAKRLMGYPMRPTLSDVLRVLETEQSRARNLL